MKTCDRCGTPFPPRSTEGPKGYARRRFCSRPCTFAFRREAARTGLPARLWAKIAVAGPDECWLWTAATTDNGYGVIGRGGRANGNVVAHVAVYLEKVGEIPAGHQVDHLCRTTLCCNPAHLEAVTQAENLRRQASAIVAERTACLRRAHPWPEHLGVTPSGQRYCRECNRINSRAAYLRRKAA